MPDLRMTRAGAVLTVLAVMASLTGVAFMSVGVGPDWRFVLALRGQKLMTLILVGAAIASSTVLFQTAVGSRILTPSVIGFDAFYELIQTGAATVVGGDHLDRFDPTLRFGLEATVMATASIVLCRCLFNGRSHDLHLLALAGLTAGGLMRSLSNFLQRVLDPGRFAVLQDRLFASFNTVDVHQTVPAGILIVVILSVAWAWRHELDALGIGRKMAIGVGVDYTRTVRRVLLLVSLLVSIATSLVGPTTFFGLLVSNLAYRLVGESRHSATVPASVCLAIICLVGGQFILERLLGFAGSLSMVLEFFGGIAFLAAVSKAGR